MEFSRPKIQKFLIFSKKKSFPDISGNGIFSYISGGNFPSSKNKKTRLKKFLIFREMELSSPKLKKNF